MSIQTGHHETITRDDYYQWNYKSGNLGKHKTFDWIMDKPESPLYNRYRITWQSMDDGVMDVHLVKVIGGNGRVITHKKIKQEEGDQQTKYVIEGGLSDKLVNSKGEFRVRYWLPFRSSDSTEIFDVKEEWFQQEL